jgi:hypothetical protein
MGLPLFGSGTLKALKSNAYAKAGGTAVVARMRSFPGEMNHADKNAAVVAGNRVLLWN